jgi:uncharacterized membrane protein (UPF0127 family)
MKVLNQTKRTLISNNVIMPKSLIDQSLGMIKYKTPQAMLLTTRFGIHTLFMRYAIDVLILDGANKVVYLRENLTPNEHFLWNPKYNKVLEVPSGVIKQSKTKKGDQLVLT